MRGKFIVVEGLEGAGKSSVIRLVQTTLNDCGLASITTREPGGTPMAEAIRECVKHPWVEDVAQETELLLMYAARKQLLVNEILPALTNGRWVVADRHDLSSQAYQGGGRGIDKELIASLARITLQGFKPDLTIYLDVEPEVGLARARGRGELDRIELAGKEFFARTRQRYLELAQEDDAIVTVNAMQDMAIVHQHVQQIVRNFVS